METAWSSDYTNAPRDGSQFLVAIDQFDCPVVVHYDLMSKNFIFSDAALSDMDGGVVDVQGTKWALMPV